MNKYYKKWFFSENSFLKLKIKKIGILTTFKMKNERFRVNVWVDFNLSEEIRRTPHPKKNQEDHGP